MPTHNAPAPTRTHVSAREVAIVIEASASLSRGMLQGVSRWMDQHEGWMITIDDRERGVPVPGWLLRWNGHGLISGLEESSLPRPWRAGRRAVVHVRGSMPASPLPGVYPDDEAAVRLGVSHLAERGLRHLAFMPGATVAVKELCDSVGRHAADLGCTIDVFDPQRTAIRRGRNDEEDTAAIAGWLASLPKPVGVIAASDVRAVRIIEACRHGGLTVPDDVAVVGIGADEVLCGLAKPGLTSITHDWPRIGHEAARMLDAAMRAGRPPSAVVFVPPSELIVRGSSDVMAVEDADLRKALRIIQAKGCTDVSAVDIATEVGVPRRLLDRKFQRVFGRTIHDELQRTKVAEAKRLLVETDDKLLVISVRSGFAHAPQLCNVFKSVVGMSPMQFRKTARLCREKPDAQPRHASRRGS
jgi:LacI family transcriptional regulator